jgi:hypothetical protein
MYNLPIIDGDCCNKNRNGYSCRCSKGRIDYATERHNNRIAVIDLIKSEKHYTQLIPPFDIPDKIKRFIRNEINSYDQKYELDKLIYSLTYKYKSKSTLISNMIKDAYEFLKYNLGDMQISDYNMELLDKLLKDRDRNKNKVKATVKKINPIISEFFK